MEERLSTTVLTLKDIVAILEATVVSNPYHEELSFDKACAADLMSDVLTSAKPGALLLTGLTTVQVIYTAEMADIRAVCFVRGKQPQEEAVELARNKNILLIATTLPMFESCGRLYHRGLRGCSEL